MDCADPRVIVPLWIAWSLWISAQLREPVRACVWNVSPNAPSVTGTWDPVRQKFYRPTQTPMVLCFQRSER